MRFLDNSGKQPKSMDDMDGEDGMSVALSMDSYGFQDVRTLGMQGQVPLQVPVPRRRRVTRADRLGPVQAEQI